MNQFARMIQTLHRELGIPPDFPDNCKIPLQYEAGELQSIGEDMFGREQYLTIDAVEHWQAMQRAARDDGIQLQVVSAFRSVDYQCNLIRTKLERGELIDDILEVNAAPGYSEHHTGRALDLNAPGCEPLSEDFEGTAAFAWLSGNASRFGFELSYPRDNPYGIIYEPWHWAWHQ